MDTDLDTLATALSVRADDLVRQRPELAPWRPAIGKKPQVSDAELITLSVMAALLSIPSEARWVRYARAHLRHLFPDLPGQSGYNKRLRRLTGLLDALIGALAADTSVFTDDLVVIDSTPVECARSRESVRRCDLAGTAEYGYCAAHTRYFWGLRLHLLATVPGLPIAYALTGAKAHERDVLLNLIHTDPAVTAPGRRTVIADKNYYGRAFETAIAAAHLPLLRPARAGEPPRPGARYLKPLRQSIESIFNTCKDQLDLERHGGRTLAGVTIRVLQRLLALTAVIWHNDHTGQPIRRSLIAYDH